MLNRLWGYVVRDAWCINRCAESQCVICVLYCGGGVKNIDLGLGVGVSILVYNATPKNF